MPQPDELVAPAPDGTVESGRPWTFVTNHLTVLACIDADAEMRVRDIARRTGITERATQGILHDLVESGYVDRRRVGRRNHYEVRRDLTLRRPLFESVRIGALLDLVSHNGN
jgi:predicted ArsR family transcriptional regulator